MERTPIRLTDALAEGVQLDRPWGRLEHPLFNSRRHRACPSLVIYPPGATEEEGRRIIMARQWRTYGLAISALAGMVVSLIAQVSGVGPSAAAAVYIAGGFALRIRGGRPLAECRIVRVVRRDAEAVRDLILELEALDDLADTMSPARYEVRWAQLYRAV